ncbi:Rpn family recombination-promoting nuclease/putative transposase [Anaerovibrio slackiae]|uniref:Rpn family recombination-promoting nuclease/putative transposase n=1 Tax=Anaerovibrio slackiae TaxID=2652309 RepID=UPI00386EB57F
MTNKKIRDTLFCKYVGTEQHLLAIANAIRGTHHRDASGIQINTLKGSFYSNLKNDISFILDTLIMMLIEHQTTLNPNMPLRLLSYVDELFRLYMEPEKRKIYSTELIQLPAPEFYVFYDGDDTSFERKTLRLSDAFKAPSHKLELIVHVYNLATGKNEDLKSICKPLREYSTFSNQYKLLRKQGLTIDEAVRDTIRYCIDKNVMKDYLQHNESEVIDMFGFEWDEKEEREALLEAGEARGEARGRINSARDLLTKGIVTLQALKSSGCYSQEELAAIAKPL